MAKDISNTSRSSTMASVPRPMGPRPRPTRRMFSIESDKSWNSYVEGSSGQATDTVRSDSDQPSPATEAEAERDIPWTDKPLAESPKSSYNVPDISKQSLVASPSLASPPASAVETPGATQRWNMLRQNFLSAGIQPPASPSAVALHSHLPSVAAASSTSVHSLPVMPPSRSASPAPSLGSSQPRSRLAQRLVFRQVVEQAQSASIDSSHRLAQEVLQACHSARFGVRSGTVSNKAGQVTIGSGVSYPSSSLVGSRRPYSLWSQHTIGSSSYSIPSLRQLHQVLIGASTSVSLGPATLPYESQVMSVCLRPFLVSLESEGEEEKVLALECWNLVIRTWSCDSVLKRAVPLSQAALVQSPHRSRILYLLSAVLFHRVLPSSPSDSLPENFEGSSPPMLLNDLVTILQALMTLLAAHARDSNESVIVRQLITRLTQGPSGSQSGNQFGACPILSLSDLETAYGVKWNKRDNDESVRAILCLGAIAKGMENMKATVEFSIWCSLVEEYWPRSKHQPTALQMAIWGSAIASLLRTFLSIASADDVHMADSPYETPMQVSHITRLLKSYVLGTIDEYKLEGCKAGVPGVLLMLIRRTENKGSMNVRRDSGATKVDTHSGHWVSQTLSKFWRDEDRQDWKSVLETAVKKLISDTPLSASTHCLSLLIDKIEPESEKKKILAFFLPCLFDHLCTNKVLSWPQQGLTSLLQKASKLDPQVFYKFVIQMATTVSEKTASTKLEILAAVSRYFPDWWLRNAEMLSVALMLDPASKPGNEDQPKYGKPRLGQALLVIELISRIRAVRLGKRTSITTGEADNEAETHRTEAVKFAAELEVRLGILLKAKEKHTLVSPIQRRLFCKLFLEMRLLTRTLKSANFLPVIVNWFLDTHAAGDLPAHAEQDSGEIVEKLRTVYNTVEVRTKTYRRNAVASPQPGGHFDLDDPITHNPFAFQLEYVDSLSPDTDRVEMIQLLVALSGLLSSNDFRRMSKPLWTVDLDCEDARLVVPACFMIMQCAEKSEREFQRIVKSDLRSTEPAVLLRTIRRIGTLANWRYQLLSLDFNTDKMHRRPFKLTRGALPFVATDIGSNLYVRELDSVPSITLGVQNEVKGGSTIPLELKKRLEEIGWTHEESATDEKLETILRPMTLCPIHQIDKNDGEADLTPPSPSSPGKDPGAEDAKDAVFQRKASTSGSALGTKRRSAFVPSLAALLPELILLVFDSHFAVASSARCLVMDLMRNEPSLVTRPVLDMLVDNGYGTTAAVSALRALLHVRRQLPHGVTHLVFNQLAGFLRYLTKQPEGTDTLQDFAYIVPILAKLVTQVSAMSILELRRSKVEIFVVPSGSLWFPSSAPSGPMFPRGIGVPADRSGGAPSTLVRIVMVRLAQNMAFLSMLKCKPQDVQVIRKSLTQFTILSRDATINSSKPLELTDFIPRKHSDQQSPYYTSDPALRSLSLMLSRSYLLLIAQVFRSLSRHLNDRNELAVLLDGLNKVLLIHSDDIGIVSQAMITLMVASTRFRRLFTSGGAFTLFMPAVLKVYAESEMHTGIRHAIEYAVNRFHALHREAFAFQTLDIMSHVMMLPTIDGDWVAKNVYTLFSALRRGVFASTPDAAGIHNANKPQEWEALVLSTADEKPQAFLAALVNGGTGDLLAVNLPEEYEAKRLGMDNFVRLFLTVIAHDPTISRAEHFLRFLRFLVPHLYHSSASTRSVLKEGVEALGLILVRAATRAKVPESLILKSNTEHSVPTFTSEPLLEEQLLGKSKQSGDLYSMRQDYLSLVVSFADAGGTLDGDATRRVFDLVKSMLRDTTTSKNQRRISFFFANFARSALLRENKPSAKEAVAFLEILSPMVALHAPAIDFAGVFDVVAELATTSLYTNDASFAQQVVGFFCVAGLNVCEQVPAETLSKLPLRRSLVTLMANGIMLRGDAVIAEVEKRYPSFEFLTEIVLPLVLGTKNTAIMLSEGNVAESWQQISCQRVWVRLLAYAMSAYQKKKSRSREASPNPKFDGRGQTKTPPKGQIATLVIAIQIIKVIIIKADAELSACFPGVWCTIGGLLKAVLWEGNAAFALSIQNPSPSQSPTPSPTPSPAVSPINAPKISPFISDYQSSQSIAAVGAPASPVHLSEQRMLHPRMLDYTMWSLFELLLLCRTPLTLQMRSFMQEKVAVLDQELRYQHPQHSRSTSVRSLRYSPSSPFSKPRRRVSGLPTSESATAAMGPSTSLTLTPSSSFVGPLDGGSTRQAGYQRSPQTPYPGGGSSGTGPRIVHLGPVEGPGRPNLPFSMSQGARVKDGALVAATYGRIRLVLALSGYYSSSSTLAVLWPHSDAADDGEDGTADRLTKRMWTRREALDAVVYETRTLVNEFDESPASEAFNESWLGGADVSRSTSF